MDPTYSADSVFLLNIYNDLNDEGEFDLVRYSKPALDVRKRKSQIPRFPIYSNNPMNETDRARTSEKIAAIRDSNSQLNENVLEKKFHFKIRDEKMPTESYLNHATLRIFKKPASKSFEEENLTLVVYQILDGSGYHEMTIAKKSLERENHGWIELEISDTVRNWMDGTSSNLGLVIKLIDDRGNKYPLRLFGIVENEEEIEFIPFLVCY